MNVYIHTSFIRRLQQETREKEMQEKIVAAERERVLRQKQLAQEEELARELERLKWEEQKDERIRQQIKENRRVLCIVELVKSVGNNDPVTVYNSMKGLSSVTAPKPSGSPEEVGQV